MTTKTIVVNRRAFLAKEKRNAELRAKRKKIGDAIFNFLVRFTVLCIGIGLLFGLFILLASILGPILGIDLLESEQEAEARAKAKYCVELVEGGEAR